MKIRPRTIIIGSLIVVACAYGAYRAFFADKGSKYTLETVRRGPVAETVTETGRVEAARELNLYFKASGTVAEVLVKEGDRVTAGTPLMKLDGKELQTRRRAAASALASAEAKYAQALAGASSEELKVAESVVADARARAAGAEQSLSDARRSLEDVKASNEATLAGSYSSLTGTLESAYLKSSAAVQVLSNDVYDAAGNIRSDFSPTDSVLASRASASFREAKAALDLMASDLEATRRTTDRGEIDRRADLIIAGTATVRDAAQSTNAMMQAANPAGSLTQAAFDTRKSEVKTAWTDMVAALNSVETQHRTTDATKATAISARNSAETAVSAAASALASAQSGLDTATAQLNLKKAPLREVDRAVYQAAVSAARADLETIDRQVADATMLAPEDGIVGTVDLKAGELATAAVRALSLISARQEVTADISELDIGKVAVGSLATASFDALGAQPYGAKVVRIAPREKEKDSDVYYVTALVLDDAAVELRPGMTADIAIKVGEKGDVVLAPKRLIIKREGQTLVRVLKGGAPVDVKVQVGLEGEDDVEIIEGLSSGDQLITGETP